MKTIHASICKVQDMPVARRRPAPLRYLLPVMLIAGGPLHPAAAAEDDVPVRKSGQWELKTVSPATGTYVSRVCITPKDHILIPQGRDTCSKPKVERAGEQTIIDTTCESDGVREHISGLFTGDFASWYRAIVKMTFDPPGSGPPNVGVTIEGKYLGPDC